MGKKSKKINWIDHGISFIVVLFSILLAFALDGYRSELKDRDIEKRNMLTMLDDLEADIMVLDSLSQYYKKGVEALERVKRDSITRFNYKKKSNAQLIEDRGYMTIYLGSFSPKNITYESMRMSGRLDIVTNPQLKKAIIEHNYKTYGDIKENEGFIPKWEQVASSRLNEIQRYDIANNEVVLKQPDYNQFLGREIIFFKNKQEDYQILKKKCITLAKMIKKEFNIK